MQTIIFCETNANGCQDFYLKHGDKKYFLFEQSFRKTIKSFFGNGVSLERGMKFANTTSFAVRNVMSKLPIYIKYIEKEFGVAILEQTKRKLVGKPWMNKNSSIKNKSYRIKEGA